MAGVIIGEGILSINGEILQGLHDSNYIGLEADGDIGKIEKGRDGVISTQSVQGEVGDITLRMRLASTGDRFLRKLLNKQLRRENNWLSGQYIRSILEDSGIQSVTTLLENGMFVNIPPSSSSAETDVETGVVVYKLQFGNITTMTYE